jgi:hypothetical protein
MGTKKLEHVAPKPTKLMAFMKLNVNLTLNLIVVVLMGTVVLDQTIATAKDVNAFKKIFL